MPILSLNRQPAFAYRLLISMLHSHRVENLHFATTLLTFDTVHVPSTVLSQESARMPSYEATSPLPVDPMLALTSPSLAPRHSQLTYLPQQAVQSCPCGHLCWSFHFVAHRALVATFAGPPYPSFRGLNFDHFSREVWSTSCEHAALDESLTRRSTAAPHSLHWHPFPSPPPLLR